MTPECWQEVERIYNSAVRREPSQRTAFLQEACAGDQGLLREVESLLGYQEEAKNFMAAPAMAMLAQQHAKDRAQSWTGRQMGFFKILSLLGTGGMGEVYLAQDTRLDRMVALKVLPAYIASDPDRIRRFTLEAKAASVLKHPNVTHIYEIGEFEGVHFIAMEYVEGQTLAAKIRNGPLQPAETVEIGLQVADALDDAHSKRIIHRDIKPANLMLTSRGEVKVLDFGLARVEPLEEQSVSNDISTVIRTRPGMMMGTAPYMSPEQILGKELDHRTDIFSLGVVLYEMATGILPFREDATTTPFDAILHKLPSAPFHLNPELPSELNRIILHALEKDREVRYQAASNLRADLQQLKRSIDSGRAGTRQIIGARDGFPREKWRRRVAALPGAAILIAAVVLAVWLRSPLPSPKVLGSVQLSNDGRQKPGLGSSQGFSSAFAASMATDGSRLYFNELLAGGLALAQITKTGGETAPVPNPFHSVQLSDISPNGLELLVISNSIGGSEGPLWVVPTLGGSPRRLPEVLAFDATWTPDGQRITYSNGPDLYVTKMDKGEPRKLVTAGGRAFWIRWSPNLDVLRFTLVDPQTLSNSLWEVSADGTRLHPLFTGWDGPPAECCGNWTADGKYFVFQSTRNGVTNLWAIREDRNPFHKINREPVQLTNGPMNLGRPVPSKDGKRIFTIGGLPRSQLVYFESKSRKFVPYLSGISATDLGYSRDGEWVAYVAVPEGTLWRSKLDGSERLQLSFAPMQAGLPRWSPDGKRIAFMGTTPGKTMKIYLVSPEGGSPEQIIVGEKNQWDPGWSPDGNVLVFGSNASAEVSTSAMAIYMLDLRTHQVSTLPGSQGLYSPRWSPDKNYVAALKAGPESLWLYDLRTQKWKEMTSVSVGYPSWSRDGSYIYFDNLPFQREAVIWRVRISDCKLEQVVSLKDLLQPYGILGFWTGLTPDDSPVLSRNVGSQEIYALDWVAP